MNEVVKLQSSPPTKIDYQQRTKQRKWELSYGWKDKFYLTDKEKEAFMSQISIGKDVVEINGAVFTRFFKSLVRTNREEDYTFNLSEPLVEMISEEQRNENRKKILEIKNKLNDK